MNDPQKDTSQIKKLEFEFYLYLDEVKPEYKTISDLTDSLISDYGNITIKGKYLNSEGTYILFTFFEFGYDCDHENLQKEYLKDLLNKYKY